MPDMAAAAVAMNLGADQVFAVVLHLIEGARDYRPEGGPALRAVELPLGLEKHQLASGAFVDSLAVLVQQRTAEFNFRGCLAQYVILVGRQQPPPLRLGMGHRE